MRRGTGRRPRQSIVSDLRAEPRLATGLSASSASGYTGIEHDGPGREQSGRHDAAQIVRGYVLRQVSAEPCRDGLSRSDRYPNSKIDAAQPRRRSRYRRERRNESGWETDHSTCRCSPANTLVHRHSSPRTGIVSMASVHWSGRYGVHELPNCIGDPPPDCRAAAVAIRSKLRRPYRTLRLSLIAVALEHQVGDTPDVDFRDHAQRLSGTIYLR
jgi:hypothetical protein